MPSGKYGHRECSVGTATCVAFDATGDVNERPCDRPRSQTQRLEIEVADLSKEFLLFQTEARIQEGSQDLIEVAIVFFTRTRACRSTGDHRSRVME